MVPAHGDLAGRRLARRLSWPAALVFVLAAVALVLSHHSERPPVPPRVAIRATLSAPTLRGDLSGSHWNRTVVTAVDAQLDRVQVFAGPREVAEAAVGSGPRIVQAITVRQLPAPYGDWIAYEPAVLGGLAALFFLLTAVAPWRRLRNLDVMAALSLVAPVVLLQHRLPDASLLAALPGLLYLLARCVRRALAGDPAAAPPSTPLWTLATRGLDPGARVRLLWLLLGALGAVFLAVSVSSPAPVDVAVAVMEGATRLLHGVLPYGHMPGDIIHGDTYPLLTYLAYVPVAALTPVASSWDSLDAALAVSAVLAIALAGLAARAHRSGWGSGAPGPSAGGRELSLRAALAVLAFPPLLVTASSGTTDVGLGVLLAGALLAYRRPARASALLTLATWFKLAPAPLLLLVLAPLRGRSLTRALAAAAAVSMPLAGLVLALAGPHGFIAMARAIAFQFSRGSTHSLWSVLGLSGLQPFAQAAILAFIVHAAWRLRRAPAEALERPRVAALWAAVLIALELTADYWSFLYLVWLLPLWALSLFEGQPATVAATAEPAPASRTPEPELELAAG